jgi:hypothetical protein
MNTLFYYPLKLTIAIFMMCFGIRIIEYLFIRTDQTIIGEAFIHKVCGIILLAVIISFYSLTWADIGFKNQKTFNQISIGLLLGLIAFTIAYGIEFLLEIRRGNEPGLKFFVSGFSYKGDIVRQSGFIFLIICVVGNLINVFMEEGMFRGLFIKVLEGKYSFFWGCVISSMLFGLWHIIQPLRFYFDGQQALLATLKMGIFIMISSALIGVQYCLFYKISGSLWIGLTLHFINNIATNLIHVSTKTGTDEMQTLRIAIAQTILFLIVIFVYYIYYRNNSIPD